MKKLTFELDLQWFK